jgi:hypothetical protein
VLVSNLLAVLGVACVLVAVGQLAGWWVALMVLGLVLLAASFAMFREAARAAVAANDLAVSAGSVASGVVS